MSITERFLIPEDTYDKELVPVQIAKIRDNSESGIKSKIKRILSQTEVGVSHPINRLSSEASFSNHKKNSRASSRAYERDTESSARKRR